MKVNTAAPEFSAIIRNYEFRFYHNQPEKNHLWMKFDLNADGQSQSREIEFPIKIHWAYLGMTIQAIGEIPKTQKYRRMRSIFCTIKQIKKSNVSIAFQDRYSQRVIRDKQYRFSNTFLSFSNHACIDYQTEIFASKASAISKKLEALEFLGLVPGARYLALHRASTQEMLSFGIEEIATTFGNAPSMWAVSKARSDTRPEEQLDNILKFLKRIQHVS